MKTYKYKVLSIRKKKAVEGFKKFFAIISSTILLLNSFSPTFALAENALSGISEEKREQSSIAQPNEIYGKNDSSEETPIVTFENSSSEQTNQAAEEIVPAVEKEITTTSSNVLSIPGTPTPISPSDDSAIKGIAFTQIWTAVAGSTQYTYESCYVDPGDMGGICTSPKFTGTYTTNQKTVGAGQPNSQFWWRVKSSAGVITEYGESFKLTIDNNAPSTVINDDFSHLTNSSTPTFTGTSTDSYLAGIGFVQYKIEDTFGNTIFDWSYANPTDGEFHDIVENFYFKIPSISDGDYIAKVKATDRAGNEEAMAKTYTFKVDTKSPTNPSDVTSPSHNSTSFTKNSKIDISWTDGGTDFSGSGIDGYSYLFSTNEDDKPAQTKLIEENVNSLSSSSLSEGKYYFIIRTVDNAGNWSEPSVFGPYLVDATAPSVPTLISPANGAFINKSLAIMDWSDVTDINPVKYSYKSTWNGGSYQQDDLTTSQIDATGTNFDAVFSWQVRACDSLNNCSNWSDPWIVTIDSTKPIDPNINYFSSTPAISTWSNDNTVYVNWPDAGQIGGASDNLSGVKGYYYLFTKNSTDNPGTKNFTADSEATSNELADGTSWYFHLSTVDKAGNVTSTVHYGPFFIDTTPPIYVGSISPSFTVDYENTYVNGMNFTVRSSFSDSGSGIDTTTCLYTLDGTNFSPSTDNFWVNATVYRCREQNIAVPDGTSLTLNFKIKDLAGNEAYDETRNVNRIADSSAPTIGEISVTPAYITGGLAYTSGMPTIEASVFDSVSPITSCELRYKKSTDSQWSAYMPATYDNISGKCLYTFSSNLDDKTLYDFQFRVRDSIIVQTHYALKRINSIIVDSSIPIVNAGSDRFEKSKFMQDAVIDGMVSGVKLIEWSKQSGPGNVTFYSLNSEDTEISVDNDGIYVIRLTVTDNVGNVGYDEMTLTWDSTAPVIIFNNDVELGPVRNDIINISVYDPDDLSAFTYSYGFSSDNVCDENDNYDQSFTNGADFEFSVEDYNGNYICVKAVDALNNTSYLASLNFLNIDEQPPYFSDFTIYPKYKDFTNVKPFVSIKIDDLNSGVDFMSCKVEVNGTKQDATYDSGYCYTQLSLTDSTNAIIKFFVSDNVGNEAASDEYQYKVDGLAPSVPTGLTYQTENGEVKCGGYTNLASVIMDWDDSTDLDNFGNTDFASGLRRYRVRVTDPSGEQTIYYTNIKTKESMMKFTFEENGVYKFRVRSVDNLTNVSGFSSNCEITFDNTKPTVDSVSDKTFVEGESINLEFLNDVGAYDNIDLSALAINVHLEQENGNVAEEKLEISLDGAGKGGTIKDVMDLTGLIFPADTSIIPEGVYTITYFVTDKAGNRSDCDAETDGDQDCKTVITLNNVAPEVKLEKSQTINEGEAAIFSSSFSDPSFIEASIFYDNELNNPDDSPWTSYVDYGEGKGFEKINEHNIPGIISNSLSNIYEKDGKYNVKVKVCEAIDNESNLAVLKSPINSSVFGRIAEKIENNMPYYGGEGKCGEATVQVNVNNVAPAVVINASPATSVPYGTSTTLTANVTGGNPPIIGNWSGACNGTENSYQLPSVTGTYTCTYTATDIDGDIASATITVTVGNRVYSVNPVLGNPAQEENIEEEKKEEESEEKTETEEVLGEETCEKKSKVSGYIYEDSNNNSVKDSNEQGIKDIEVKLFDDNGKEIASTKTNSEGYYEFEACPGKYQVKISSTPKNIKLSTNSRFINIEKDTDLSDVNFAATKNKSIPWWIICSIPIVLIIIAGILYTVLGKKK